MQNVSKMLKRMQKLDHSQRLTFWREYLKLLARSIRLERVPESFQDFDTLLKRNPTRDGYKLSDRVKFWGRTSAFITFDCDADAHGLALNNLTDYIDYDKMWEFKRDDTGKYGYFVNLETGQELNLYYTQSIPLFENFVKKALDKVTQTNDNTTTENNKETTEMTIKQKATNTAKSLVTTNVDAAKNAAFINMGKVGNTVIAEKLAPRLPLVIRGQAKKPMGRLLLANAFAAGVKQFAPENDKLELVAESMVNEAMLTIFDGFDIEGLTKELLSATAGQLETLTGEKQETAK